MAVRSASDLVASPPIVAQPQRVKKSPHPLNAAFVRTWRNPLGKFGLIILGILVFSAIFAPFISPYDPIVQHQGKELLGPNAQFWFCTGDLGHVLPSPVIYAAGPAVAAAVLLVLIVG